MEHQQNMAIINRKGRIPKRTRRKQLHNPQSHALFPLLLAALLSKSRNNHALIKKCLNQIILSLPHFLLEPVISLIPALLKSNCAEIVCKSAEVVGAASLSSFEMNEKIALEDEIIKSLISLLGSPMRKISMVAHNAMLDLATASVGRQFSSLTEDRFNNNWRTIFGFLVNRILTESKFSDILKHIEVALKENEDPLRHLRWMRHLVVGEGIENSSSSSILSVDSRYLLDLSGQHWGVAEEVFMQVMSKFCKEVEFNNIEVRYKTLLEKYRDVRKQYTHGMLALHL